MAKIPVYIALLRGDGTEPDPVSGYIRALVENMSILDIPTLPMVQQIPFPEVTAPGYGMITEIRAYTEEDEPIYLWRLPEPVNAHEGTIPVIWKGRLLLGVDVTAKVILNSEDLCEIKNL